MDNDKKRRDKMWRKALSTSGFDIVHPFSLNELDDSVMEHLPVEHSSDKMGYLIGNTRTIWMHFIEWLSQQPNWSELVNPFEGFVEETIVRCVGQDALIFWTHETKRYIVPVQRMAHQTGLAYLSAGQFNIHPQFGAWFALRAVIIVSGQIDCNPEVSNPSSDVIEVQSAALFKRLLERKATWQEWLSLRDLYEVGRAQRYSEPQIQYHYTRDKGVLVDEVERLQSS